MRYRAEVDGLRAVAIVPVVLFHAGFGSWSGGFVGVDIFFVISGYLITRLIYDDIQSGSFSLVHFYERRARRILPALFFICLLSVPFAWQWLLPRDFRDFSESLGSVAVFASNVYFWLKRDYFAAPAETTPLLHTWSLAVEEQFYLLFPLMLLASRRMSRRWLIAAISAGSLVSLCLAEFSGRAHPSADFYLVHTRAWELGVGAILALSDGRLTIRQRTLREMAAIAAAALIAYSVFALDESLPYPGFVTLLPVAGAAILIATATQETIVGRILGSRPLVGIGLISYSAYLWHQPLFAFARYRMFSELTTGVSVLLVLTAVALSYASWRFVEQPFRGGRRVSRAQVFSLAASGSAVMIAVGLAGILADGFPGRFDSVARRFPGYQLDNRKLQAESWRPLRSITNDRKYTFVRNRADMRLWFAAGHAETKVLIVGNSHSKDLFNAFVLNQQLFPGYEFARFGTQIGCLDSEGRNEFFRSPNYRAADIVIVSTRWSDVPNCNSEDDDFEGLEHLAVIARRDGKLLVVTSSTLEFPQRGHCLLADATIIAAARTNSAISDQALAASINRRLFEIRGSSAGTAALNVRLRALSQRLGLLYLDKDEYLCDDSARTCLGMTPGLKKTLYDYGHYTLDGSREFGMRLYAAGWMRRIERAYRATDPRQEDEPGPVRD